MPTDQPSGEPDDCDQKELQELRQMLLRWAGKATRVTADHAAHLERLDFALCAKLSKMRAARDKLQAFKDWVHGFLDSHGVPHHPPGTHGAAGCRIGDRMDWLIAREAKLWADNDRLRRVEAAARAYCNNKLTVSERFSALDALTAALADRPAAQEGPTHGA